MAIVEISSFAYFILCLCIVTFKIVHIVWLIGIKTNGNYRNFIIFTCFIRSIMCYVYSNTKTYTISPLVWLVGCKCRGNYRNFDNFPSIFCRLVKNCQTKCIKFNTHIWSMLWHVPHRFYRCLTHRVTQNLPYKYNLNMGTPNHIYIGYSMVFQYQIVIFLLYY